MWTFDSILLPYCLASRLERNAGRCSIPTQYHRRPTDDVICRAAWHTYRQLMCLQGLSGYHSASAHVPTSPLSLDAMEPTNTSRLATAGLPQRAGQAVSLSRLSSKTCRAKTLLEILINRVRPTTILVTDKSTTLPTVALHTKRPPGKA